MTIHKEGRTLLFILLIVFAALGYVAQRFLGEGLWLNIIIGVCLAFYLIVLQFFRNPSVTVVRNDKHIIAPADGKVVVIEETTETEYLKDDE